MCKKTNFQKQQVLQSRSKDGFHATFRLEMKQIGETIGPGLKG